MPQRHLSPVTAEETQGATAPNPAHGALETSCIDDWGMPPGAAVPGAPVAWRVGPGASIPGVSEAWGAGLEETVSAVLDAWDSGQVSIVPAALDARGPGPEPTEAWGVGPGLFAAHALSPVARGLRAATSEAWERGEPPPVATEGTRRRGG